MEIVLNQRLVLMLKLLFQLYCNIYKHIFYQYQSKWLKTNKCTLKDLWFLFSFILRTFLNLKSSCQNSRTLVESFENIFILACPWFCFYFLVTLCFRFISMSFIQYGSIIVVMWIRIRSDPHSFGSVDPDPDPEVWNEWKSRVQQFF